MIDKLRELLNKKKGQQSKIEADITALKTKIRRLKLKKINIEKASVIIQEVARLTQEELKYRITAPVTSAIESIFEDDPHSLVMEFPLRRDKTECDIYFEQNGNLSEPLRGGGGGMADVASFALRPSLLSLHHPQPRKLIILDEPFKHLDEEKHHAAGQMLKEVSEKLGLQILMTTHSNDLSECTDKIFKVTKINGKSKITEA